MTSHIKYVVIPIHILAIMSLLLLAVGKIEWNWLVATFVGWFMISGLGVAVGLHRLLSHKSFEASLPVKRILGYLGCLGAQGSPIFWVSLHRGVHHPFSDTHKDVHSPIHGFWSAYMGWQFRLKPSDVPFRSGLELTKDVYFKFMHKHYYKVLWGTVLIFALVDYRLSLMGLLVPMMISMHMENMVDLFCHIPGLGYRNHQTRDNSTNVFLLGIFAFGQGWHNNHHARPSDYNFGGERWFEFDICRLIVPMLKKRNSLLLPVKDSVGVSPGLVD